MKPASKRLPYRRCKSKTRLITLTPRVLAIRAYQRQLMIDRRAQAREDGLCTRCAVRRAVRGRKSCQECLVARRASMRGV